MWLFWFACSEQTICLTSTSYQNGDVVFADRTDEWGLSNINAVGTRMNAVDYDGDGWVDLFIRKHGGADDFSSQSRSSWLLRNLEGTGFEDVTESSGIRMSRSLTTGRPGQVVAFGDVDNDGDLDVYTGYNADGSNGETSEIMLNAGDGTFLLGPDDSDVRKSNSDQPAGASFVDYNRDGLLDLWTGQASGTQDRLLWGYGDGSFVDVTLGVELRTSGWSDVQTINEGRGHSISWSATACDLNNDGWPDLLASSYGRAPNHLWRSQEGATFVNQSVASGYAYDDNQDWSDDESARCWCTLHPDAEDCDGVPAPEFIVCNSDSDAFRWDHETSRNAYRLGGNSGATVCADLNNDGWNDLITTEIVHWDVGASSDPSEILYNTQSDDIVFERPGNDRTGLTRKHDGITWDDGDMSATAFDFDNDMRKDIYIGSSDYSGTRGLLYHQTEEGLFEEVALSAGIEHTRSHGVAVADFDNDGDLDMIVGHSSSRCGDDCPESFHARLYENQRDGMSNFVQVHLVGTGKSNSAAIGARVEVTASGVTQMQEVGGGYGHYGAQNPLILHFGLGEACDADVTVFWPDSSRTQESYSLEAGHRYRIEQGSEESILLSLSQRE